MNLDLLFFYVFIYLSIIIVTVFNYVCVSAFEQGHLDPWRALIIIVIIIYHLNFMGRAILLDNPTSCRNLAKFVRQIKIYLYTPIPMFDNNI